jgi:tetratricopeptide (TPR) repeat protein
MFNALEVTTLKARFYQALSALAAGLVGLPLALGAQATRTPDPNAPRLMVGVFRSAEKNLGVQTADAIRARLTSDVPVRSLWVIPKQDITNTLDASGFPTTEALAPHDARALGQLLRADEYIVGNIVRDSAGYRVDAQLVLTRDNSLVQPLGSFRADRPDRAAPAVSNAFRAAQRQFEAERNCVRGAREKKYAEAITAARRGIADYPQATLARICLANVYIDQRDAATNDALKKAYNDSASIVSREILNVDPLSRRALTIQYDALRAANDPAATDVLLRLAAADPQNSQLIERVINELAAGGQAARAVPFVNKLVSDNPGDPNALQLQYKVKFAAKDFKGGLAAGQELLRADTAYATADLYSRLIAAAVQDSQPQLASQFAAQGVAKFPDNGDLLVTYAQALRSAGQNQQAIEVLNRAAQRNPKIPNLYSSQARIFADLGQHEQALQALQTAVQQGDSAANVALYAVQIGQAQQRSANASKKAEDFESAIRYLEFARRTSATPEGQFLLGATALTYGQSQLLQAQNLSKSPSSRGAACTATKAAQAQFVTAQTNLPAGGKFNPQLTSQLLSGLSQLSPAADQFAKALCK